MSNVLLDRLKIDIGIINNTVYDTRLQSLLDAAQTEVNKFVGEDVDTSDTRDAELVIDYARWQWLCRREPTPMPASLLYRLNCRAFEKNAPKKDEPDDTDDSES